MDKLKNFQVDKKKCSKFKRGSVSEDGYLPVNF